MRKELSDYLFINVTQYKDSMRRDDCLPEGVYIVNMEVGDLTAVHTPMGDMLIRDGDYILTTPDGKYFVCDKHQYHSIKVHPELVDIINKEPENDYVFGYESELLNHRMVELATVYILNNKIIKVRPGFKGTIIDAIKENRGVYIQYNSAHFKYLHIYEDRLLDEIEHYNTHIKETYGPDFSRNITIYKWDDKYASR